jgi:hypothetical protein
MVELAGNAPDQPPANRFPRAVWIAGLIWMVFGGLILLVPLPTYQIWPLAFVCTLVGFRYMLGWAGDILLGAVVAILLGFLLALGTGFTVVKSSQSFHAAKEADARLSELLQRKELSPMEKLKKDELSRQEEVYERQTLISLLPRQIVACAIMCLTAVALGGAGFLLLLSRKRYLSWRSSSFLNIGI